MHGGNENGPSELRVSVTLPSIGGNVWVSSSHSITRTRPKIAHAMAEVLGAECVAPEELPSTSLDGCWLVGFGSGVYYGQMHQALLERLRGLPDAPEATKPAFVFSTSGLPFLAKLWHTPLKKLLARKGFEVGGEFACRGFDTWGPLWLTGGLNWRHPDERDSVKAREFAWRVAGAGV